MTTAPSPAPRLADWVAGARPRTLPAAVVPVAVGAGAAAGAGGAFGDGVVWWRVVAALAVSLLLQIGVNYANDYSDGVRGADDVRVGPMRLVATGTASPDAVKRAALGTFLLAAVIGLALAAVTTWWLVAVGAAAILAAWGYTGGPKPYGYLGFGELFVFAFFGLVATVGTTYVALERIPGVTWVAATGVGFLACALLVINNLRDIPTDAAVGKRTLAVRLGARRARVLYAVLVVGAFLAVAAAAGVRSWSLIALAGLGSARDPINQVMGGADGRELIPILGETGKTQMIYGLLFAIGLALG
ncbi:MAG: 1,4-dihydroxy-2-naphthoate polyprenyltransferase [Ilumatobacter sp.]